MLYLGRQNRAILSVDKIRWFLHDTRQIFCVVILSADKIGRFCHSSDIPLTLRMLVLDSYWYVVRIRCSIFIISVIMKNSQNTALVIFSYVFVLNCTVFRRHLWLMILCFDVGWASSLYCRTYCHSNISHICCWIQTWTVWLKHRITIGIIHLDFLFIIYNIHVPVSYTHLTLPTNREV